MEHRGVKGDWAAGFPCGKMRAIKLNDWNLKMMATPGLVHLLF